MYPLGSLFIHSKGKVKSVVSDDLACTKRWSQLIILCCLIRQVTRCKMQTFFISSISWEVNTFPWLIDRGYFRCTHKHDQGCQATKHVQKSENNPSLYVVTYMGQHTCKDVLKTPQLILDSTSAELCVLNCESTMPRKHDPVLTSSFTSLKHETIIAEKPIDLNQASSSPSSYLISFDHETFDSHLQMEFSMGDVASSVYSSTSSHNLDMDMKDSFKLDDVLPFGEPEFLIWTFVHVVGCSSDGWDPTA